MILKLFDNEYMRCEFDDSLQVVLHRWKKAPPFEEFKANLVRALEEYKILNKTYRKLAWLADTNMLGELDAESEQWLVNEWEELLFKKGGVRIHAVILGDNLFSDYPMEKFKLDAERKFRELNIRLAVFSNQWKAYEWIRQQLFPR